VVVFLLLSAWVRAKDTRNSRPRLLTVPEPSARGAGESEAEEGQKQGGLRSGSEQGDHVSTCVVGMRPSKRMVVFLLLFPI